MRLLLVLGLAVCWHANGQNAVIYTIAGYGSPDFSGDGGMATAATLSNPRGIALDASGNLFIVDTGNQRVRKISLSGIISTVAGNGVAGFSGDGGPATAASLNSPNAVAVDASGNLYIADVANQRIRKVSSSGIITTIAGTGNPTYSGDGGPATSASLQYPFGVAVDGTGNLFIADMSNNRIRKVSSSGIITTVAGSGISGYSGDGGPATAAGIFQPRGVFADRTGNLFIADSGNNRVRMVAANGIITTVAGDGSFVASKDGVPATSVSVMPFAVCLDAVTGDLYIGEMQRVRKVSTAGVITTVAGNGSFGFNGDLIPATAAAIYNVYGIAADAAGNLFITDSDNQRIREVATSVPPLAANLFVLPGTLYQNLGAGTKQLQPLQIGGAAGIAWQATATTSSGGAWLSVSPFAGQTPASVTALIDTTNLSEGNYQGSITIRAPLATPSSITIKINLSVYLQPSVAYQVTNSASNYISGRSGFGIAQGSLFTVYGYNIGPQEAEESKSFPISLSLGGTSIQITMSGVKYDAPMISASDLQAVAMLPSVVPEGDGSVVVTRNGRTAYPIPIHVVKSAFGIYAIGDDGAGLGMVQNAANEQLTFAQPAHPGDVVTVWGTGLGPVAGEEAQKPLPGNLFRAEVFVGNRPALVQYAGRSGCCGGMDEIVFQIPTELQGCFVPLVVRSSNFVSNFVSIPIAPAGKACSDPIGASPDLLSKSASQSGLKYGAIAIGPIPALDNFGGAFAQGLAEKLSSMLGTRVTSEDVQTVIRASHSRRGRALKAVMQKYEPMMRAKHIDPNVILAMANMLNYRGVTARFQTATSTPTFSWEFAAALPPPGTCTAAANRASAISSPYSLISGGDAGQQLLLTAPSGTQTLNRLSNGTYQLALGSTTKLGLPSGTYTLSGSGGKDVGAFTASLDVGAPLAWTNKASIGFIDRSEPLTINWTGGPPTGYVVFGAEAGRQAGFTCVADVRDGTLTVPDYILSAMPHTSDGVVFLVAHPLLNLFNAPGLDVGFFADMTMDSKSLAFH
jgi:uncharacterized protein (TIGR03437 family)